MRAALEPLQSAFGFEAVEREGGLVFRMSGDGPVCNIPAGAVGDTIRQARQMMDKAPERLRLTCIDPDKTMPRWSSRRGAGKATRGW